MTAELLKILEEISSDIDFDISDVFESDIENRVVYIGYNNIPREYRRWHRGYIKNKDIYLELYATLHEIGHIISLDTYSERDTDFLLSNYDIEVEEVTDLFKTSMTSKEIFKKYKQICLERLADEWANDFIANHENIFELQKRFIKAYKPFRRSAVSKH